MRRVAAAAGAVVLLLGLPAAAHGGRCDRIEPVEGDTPWYVPDEEGRPPAAAAPGQRPVAAKPPGPAAADPQATGPEASAPQGTRPIPAPPAAPGATHAEQHAAAQGPLVLATQEPALDVRRVVPVRSPACLRRTGMHCPIHALRAELTTEPGLHVVADLDRRELLWSGRYEPFATAWSRRRTRTRSLRFAQGFSGLVLGPGEYRLVFRTVDPSGLVRSSRLVEFRLQ